MFVFDFVFILFIITWLPLAGIELSPWLSARVFIFLFYVVSIVYVPFPLDVWCRMWNLTVSVSDHCLF